MKALPISISLGFLAWAAVVAARQPKIDDPAYLIGTQIRVFRYAAWEQRAPTADMQPWNSQRKNSGRPQGARKCASLPLGSVPIEVRWALGGWERLVPNPVA
jgi:hypothetical protein